MESGETGHKRFRLDCICGDCGHSVVFAAIYEPDWHETLVSVTDMWMTPRGILGRVWAALTLFWRGEYCRMEGQIKDEQLIQLALWLLEVHQRRAEHPLYAGRSPFA